MTQEDVAAAALAAGLEEAQVESLLTHVKAKTENSEESPPPPVDEGGNLEEDFAADSVKGGTFNPSHLQQQIDEQKTKLNAVTSEVKRLKVVTNDIAEEIAKNLIVVVPVKSMYSGDFHRKDGLLVQAVRKELGANFGGVTTTRYQVKFKCGDFLKPKECNEKVKAAIAKDINLSEVYKMGFNQSVAKTLDAKPAYDMFASICSILKMKQNDQKPRIKTMFPVADAVVPRFSLEDEAGTVFANGEQTGLGRFVVRALPSFQMVGTKITAQEFNEQLEEDWSHPFPYSFEVQLSGTVLQRAPPRELREPAKGKAESSKGRTKGTKTESSKGSKRH